MSERMTAIDLPGTWGGGIADYGRKTVPEMIALLRSHATANRTQAEAILAANDEDFRVQTYIGERVRRDRIILQEGKKP